MFRDSLTAAILRQGPRRHAVSMALLLTLVFVASLVSAGLRFEGWSTAPWWPAAGISVVAALAARGRGLTISALILLVTAAANVAAGTIWWVAIGFGIANASEAWLVAAIMRYRRPPGHRFRHPDSVRFLFATFVGAGVIGILAGAFVAASGGDLLGTATAVAASHGSAVLLIGVLGLVPRSSFVPTSPWALAFQVLVLGVTIGIAFAPFQTLPLVFLPFPILAWAAFRFTAGVTLIELALVSITVTVLSFLGWGPFTAVATGDGELLIGLVQVFTLSLGASLLPVAVAQDDRTDLYLRLSAREQLLRGAIVSANAGFVVARREETGSYRVVESNPNGERMLASWLTRNAETTTVDAAHVAALLTSRPDGVPTSIGFPEGVHLDVIASPVAGATNLVLIQAIDVTEQRKAAQALTDAFDHERETADRMRALAAQKDEFLSSVSHELRTPVTSILGYSEELSEADLPASERHSVEVITRNARRLAQLVDDLLSISRRAGTPPPEATEVAVAAAIRGCVDELSPLADRAQVTIEVTVDDDFVITGDALSFDRILVNLLANAIKFTPPGGRIDITASADVDGVAHIEVADTGRGIPPSELTKVFERFYRVTDASTFVPGTGLGLPIVRDLATRMGGSVELHSDGATGTTAIVELPLHAVAR